MHFEYLAVQRGRISDLCGDFKKWKRAYDKLIEWDFQTMKPALPLQVWRMLDVGGGLSGISARFAEHYDGVHCAVLDGKNDAPVVVHSNRTYNNATTTQNFLRLNGVRSQSFITPDDPIPRGFDLVISIQAWGFHFGPDFYGPQIRAAMTKEALLIADVRIGKSGWFDEFSTLFGPHSRRLAGAGKWARWAFARQPWLN